MARTDLTQKIISYLIKDMPEAAPRAYAVARYIGAQGHEARKKDEQSRLKFLGHPVPVIRSQILKVYSESFLKILDLKSLADREFFDIWHRIWKESDIFEIKSIALYELTSKRLKSFRYKYPEKFFQLANQVDNWAHSDELSGVIADIVENDFSHFDQLVKWNKSANPWLRRQSVVGIYFYARFRKKFVPPEQALELIHSLLDDRHFYVQRAVGWALREVDRVNPDLQRSFVRENVRRIAPAGWFAASELYSKSLRSQMNMLRKKK